MIYQNIKFELNMKLYFLIDQKDSSGYNCVKIDFNNLIYINILLKIIYNNCNNNTFNYSLLIIEYNL